jgi:predicted DNA-binding transcriptional regulator
MTPIDDFRLRLEQACRGREAHARFFSISARLCRDRITKVCWRDDFTGEKGHLGYLAATQVPEVLPALFAQVRAWRELAAITTAMSKGKVKRAAGGLA